MNEDMNVEDVTLPALSEDRIDEIETALFASIARERAEHDARAGGERRRRARRGRVWMGGTAAAAVVAVAAILAPSMPGILGGSAPGRSDGASVVAPESAGSGEGSGDLNAPDGASVDGLDPAPGVGDSGEQSAPTGREIIARASAAVQVDDVDAAAAAIGDEASRLGGYVEAMSIGGNGVGTLSAPEDEIAPDQTMIEPVPSGAWITVRVPAESLDEATAALRELGEVTASQVDRRDVTAEAVDLRARVDAMQASVDRLSALIADAESTRDLIAVEEALASRQAELESYRQQLKSLDDQVGMSSLTVALTTPQPVAKADPAGFGDGIAAGWSGLVTTLNGMVLAFGFLLPWLAAIGVAGLVVWLVSRSMRRRRRARAAGDADADAAADRETRVG